MAQTLRGDPAQNYLCERPAAAAADHKQSGVPDGLGDFSAALLNTTV